MQSRFDAIVFDLDGTLVASHILIAETVNRVLASQGHPIVDAEAVHAMTGLPLEDIFRAVLPATAHPSVQVCTEIYRTLFELDVLPVLRAIPGALTALESVAAHAPLAVATGRRTETAHQILERCQLAPYFGAVLGADLAARPKPAPDLLLLTLERLGGFDPRRVLVVGDSGADVGMALAAGASVCAVTWGAQTRNALLQTNPHWCIDRWEELAAILSS